MMRIRYDLFGNGTSSRGASWAWMIGLTVCAGCAHYAPPAAPSAVRPLPELHGSYYEVQPGETLWRIGRDFGIDPRTLAAINRLPSSTQVKPGQRLFIPAPPQSNRFLWPTRGQLSRAREAGNLGIEIKVSGGGLVRASRTGRVAVAAQYLAGWGKTVLLDHGDGFVTVYSGLDQVLVSPGVTVRQGNPIGRVDRHPLYFEIREGVRRRDPLRFLP